MLLSDALFFCSSDGMPAFGDAPPVGSTAPPADGAPCPGGGPGPAPFQTEQILSCTFKLLQQNI